MRLIQRVFDFYIFSNIHVAFATFCLTKITLLTFENENNEIPFFVFFATIIAYNFIRIYRKLTINSWLSDWIAIHKKGIVLVSLASFIAMLYLAVGLSRVAFLSLLPFGLFTLFYVVPINVKTKTSLRTLSGLKIFLIAFCWAGITVLFPLLNYEIVFSTDVIVVFLQRFLFVLVITIPFDIRDVKYDNESLKTLPQVLGVEKSKRLGLFLLMLFLGFNFFRENLSEQLWRVEFLITLISLIFLVRAKPQQNKYYSAFFVEAIPIIWLQLTLYN